MMQILKTIGLIFFGVVFLVIVTVLLFVWFHPAFGGRASGESLEKITQSSHRNGTIFENLIPTRIQTRSEHSDSIRSSICSMFFPPAGKKPTQSLPSRMFDAKTLKNGDMVRFGHSTVLFQTDDQIILADPVFHDASPVPGTVKPFDIEHEATIDDLPDHIDVVIISHDHYDHLDYRAIKKLNDKTDYFLVGLGVGAHLLRRGVPASKIREFDRYEEAMINNVRFVFTPTRHFSGRGLTDRFKTLRGSRVVQAPSLRLFFSGDSGYFDEFKNIGSTYGPFDIAFIEDGQYNDDRSEIHMTPEQSVQVALDLNATYMAPIHRAKFDLAKHTRKDPIERTLIASDRQHIDVATPLIGQVFRIETIPTLKWWEDVE